MSCTTKRGCLNAPTRFLPIGRLTAVFPPIEASTIAASDVGTWTTGTPRSQVAATKPTRSVVTPPPMPTKQSVRSARCSANHS